MSEDPRAIIRRFYQRVLNEGDIAAVDDFYWYDVEAAISSIPPTPYPEYGTDRLKRFFSGLRTAFPDLRTVMEELVAEDNTVVARVSYHGTHQGNVGEMAATGQRVSWSAIEVFHLFRGKIAEQFSHHEDASLVQQLGALSSSTPP